jgi:hypothetical protein
MPAFTFSPDGPTTITHPDGTVSVNAPPPNDGTVSVNAPPPDDGTVSVNAPPSDDGPAPTATAPEVSATATQVGDTSSTTFPPELPDPQPDVTSTVSEPNDDTGTLGTGTTASETAVPADAPGSSDLRDLAASPADTAESNSVVNPDGSVTTRLPDGSTQTVARLPGGATIVVGSTPPGAYSPPASTDPPRSRGWRRRSR